MHLRKLGPFECSPIGLGCMNLSHAYGAPPPAAHSERLLHAALDMGYTLFDTAAVYGFGENENLLGRALGKKRHRFVLASKCGMFRNDAGVRTIDGRPEVIRKTCEESLQRLGTDVIDLYYLHRVDRAVSVEESVGMLSDLVAEGKIRAIGLSEVSADTLRRAHAIHPVAAVQTEYSLWTRNPEIAVLEACRELGVTFVAFSPLARGFLTGKLTDIAALDSRDIRRNMPRFEARNYARNLDLLGEVKKVAMKEGCTLAQLALAWLLGRDENIVPIPGTTSLDHLRENYSAMGVTLTAESSARLDRLINQSTVAGARYNAATQMEIDTEEF
ncbi:aldo/keto reductase [Sedimenticola selenatireducens]|uniref:Aldo/keto reductase n=1 Tax=Sedimenticola selenatireducens TaxID=191960 RepID=A0A2N6CUY8_9GAMM|nr:aldo/keto reductase [Sedimenticola selenatireducens]PLX61002.1 MAG: aldo/keto reductase [Sedimenticola selenatireducens]